VRQCAPRAAGLAAGLRRPVRLRPAVQVGAVGWVIPTPRFNGVVRRVMEGTQRGEVIPDALDGER